MCLLEPLCWSIELYSNIVARRSRPHKQYIRRTFCLQEDTFHIYHIQTFQMDICEQYSSIHQFHAHNPECCHTSIQPEYTLLNRSHTQTLFRANMLNRCQMHGPKTSDVGRL